MTSRASSEGPLPSFVVVTQYFPPEVGAVQMRLASVTAELARRGHRVEVVTTLPNYPTGRIFEGWSKRPLQVAEERGLRVVRVWSWPSMGRGPGRVLNYLTFGVASLIGVMCSRPSDWVVVEYPTLFGALPAVVWCRLRRRPVIVNVADLWLDAVIEMGGLSDGVLARVLRRGERWMLLHADVVTTVTEGLRDTLVEVGVDPDRIAWLPNGADTELFSPGPSDPARRRELLPDPSDHLVLYAGTHGYVHRLEVVLEAAELLAGEPVRFLLVGGGSERDALMRRAAEMHLDNVEFREPVQPTEIAAMLREATVGLASVRRGEMFTSVRSAKIWPVMSAARPVVYSGDDEGSRLVDAIGAGIVTPAEDPEALADAIRRLIRDPDEARRLGTRGRAWVESNASWRRLVGVWLGRLEEVRTSRGRASSGSPCHHGADGPA
jgi:glycosyltransferase involved in cell wall biosynthesis